MAVFITMSVAISSEEKEGINPRLLGTVSGGRIAQPWAFIEGPEPTNQCRWYKLHDRLADDAQIVEIRRGEVVIEKAGRQEILILEGPRTKRAIVSISPTQKIINKYQALALIGNFSKVLNLVEVKPSFNTEGNSGFIVDGIPKASIAELAGLKNGDLISSVNGQGLSTPQKTIQVFRKVRNLSQIDVELLRNNRLLKLNYELKD